MGYEAIKLELIEWLTKLEDNETINYLKVVKDANVSHNDWWHELTFDQKSGIEKGLRDVDSGRVIPHASIKHKYGI